jgi:uncharacterized alkaline shock family protein YloU
VRESLAVRLTVGAPLKVRIPSLDEEVQGVIDEIVPYTAVPGRPLLRIYDPTVLRVEVPVRESLAVRLTVGAPLKVRIPSLDEEVQGVIDEIVPCRAGRPDPDDQGPSPL